MSFHQSVCFVFLLFLNFCLASNILFLGGLPSPSHHIWNRALMNKLASQGHNVTVVSVSEEPNAPTNVHYIYFENVYQLVFKDYDEDLIFNFTTKYPGVFSQTQFYFELVYKICETLTETNGFQTLLNYPDDFKYDAVIYDSTCGPCLLPFVHKFGYPPLVAVTAFSMPPHIIDLVGGHHYTAYQPFYSLSYSENMSFFQRFYNAIFYTVDRLYRNHVCIPKLDALVLPKFKSNIPSTGELEKLTSVALVSLIPGFDTPIPLPPNVIPVGGLHIEDPKPLPADIEQFANESTKGVVFFSLGTNVQSEMLGNDKLKIILTAFAQFPDYNFLWKFNGKIDAPKNVMIRSWLPQNDILAHPKTKAFFTHFGLLSVQESIYHGVPMIGMPFIFDQYRNARTSEVRGIAVAVDFATLNTEEMVTKLRLILEDPSHKRNAEKMSQNFKDQPNKPLDRAIWWIEWAIRNPSADFMESPTLKLGQIVSNCYDIVVTLTIACLLILIFILKCLTFVLNRVVSSKPNANKSRKPVKKNQ